MEKPVSVNFSFDKMISFLGAHTMIFGTISYMNYMVLVFIFLTDLIHSLGFTKTHMVLHQHVLHMIIQLGSTPLHLLLPLTLSFGIGMYPARYHASFGSHFVIKYLRGSICRKKASTGLGSAFSVALMMNLSLIYLFSAVFGGLLRYMFVISFIWVQSLLLFLLM